MGNDNRLTPEQFVMRAIEALRNPEKSTRIGKYFAGEDPVAVTNQLVQDGKIVIRHVRGGAMIYKREEAPRGGGGSGDALRKMGLDGPNQKREAQARQP